MFKNAVISTGLLLNLLMLSTSCGGVNERQAVFIDWGEAGRLLFDAPVTTTAVATRNGEVIIPSGEIMAGVRSPLILQGKFFFDSLR